MQTALKKIRFPFFSLLFIGLICFTLEYIEWGYSWDWIPPTFTIWAPLFSVWLLITYIRHIIDADVPKEFYLNNPHQDALDSVVRQLRRRAKLIRLSSHIVLGIAIFSALAGAYFFTMADQRASSSMIYELEARDLYAQSLVSDIRDLEKKLLDPAISSEKKEYISRNLNYSKNDLESFTASTRSIASGSSSGSDSDIRYLVTLIASKVGAVVLLLFLVRIFVHLYRYLLRLSAFYDARADCLQASSSDSAADLIEYLKFFSSDKLDFGKSPDSPVDQAIELSKDIISATSKKS